MKSVQYCPPEGWWDDDSVDIKSNAVDCEQFITVLVKWAECWGKVMGGVGKSVLNVFHEVAHVLVTTRGLTHHVPCDRLE